MTTHEAPTSDKYCLHGWPGDTCGQAHPYIEKPDSLLLAYDDSSDLVPGWHDSPEGRADAADQARWDRQETRTNG